MKLILGSLLALSLLGCGEPQPEWQYTPAYNRRVNVRTGETQEIWGDAAHEHWKTIVPPYTEAR